MVASALVAAGLTLWFLAALGFTFLLAAQSAFYSPAKYGYIKELAG
ncbi:hypothetical protein [Candidatus Vondammii sp. HM_W22]|nr:hypothetical protein [Candidatus Vondammii sp. HM_W22]